MVCSIAGRGGITLTHGINTINIPNDGLTVAELRMAYRDVLNVGPAARVYPPRHLRRRGEGVPVLVGRPVG
jgi:hypothetical protein